MAREASEHDPSDLEALKPGFTKNTLTPPKPPATAGKPKYQSKAATTAREPSPSMQVQKAPFFSAGTQSIRFDSWIESGPQDSVGSHSRRKWCDRTRLQLQQGTGLNSLMPQQFATRQHADANPVVASPIVLCAAFGRWLSGRCLR